MMITLEQIAKQLSAEIRGDSSSTISGANALEKAGEGDITFVSSEANAQKLANCQATAVLVGHKLKDSKHLANPSQSLLFVDDPKLAFLNVLATFYPIRSRANVGIAHQAIVHPSAKIGEQTNIHPGASIAEDVIIGDHCDIHAGVCIGPGCRIGDHCVLYPNVVLYHDIQIGERVIIHAGSVIGADGFGYHVVEGRHQKIPHHGTVRIENHAEIGANTTIDRALVGETVIGEGTKIDNLVMVAHNCELGRHNILASQVGFAGSTTTGEYVVCAGQVGIADHVHIGSHSILAAKTGVPKSLEGNETYFGSPAQPGRDAHRQMMALQRLPKMRDEMRDLKKQLTTIQSQIQSLNQSPAVSDDDSNESASAA